MMCIMPVIDVKETGKNILHLRKMRNLSVKDLAVSWSKRSHKRHWMLLSH